jgi:hypothetical protein
MKLLKMIDWYNFISDKLYDKINRKQIQLNNLATLSISYLLSLFYFDLIFF